MPPVSPVRSHGPFRFLATFALLLAATAPAFAEDSWVGQMVVVKSANVRIVPTNSKGNEEGAVLRYTAYRVLAERDTRIKVRQDGVEGWLDRKQALPSSEAVTFFSDRIRKNAADADSYRRRATAWYFQGDFDRSIEDLTQAIRLDPKSVEAFMNRGVAWYEKKEYDRAIRDYDEVVRLDPKHVDAFYNRGYNWHFKQEYDKAIRDYDEAIRLDPAFISALTHRGNAWHSKHEYDRAIQDYTAVIRLDPKSATAYNNRGYAWHCKREYEEAIRDYDEAVRLDPKYAIALGNRGSTWDSLKEFEKAIRDCDEAIRLDPKCAMAYNNRGFAWHCKQEYDRALRDYDAAVRLAPTDPVGFNSKAWLLATCSDEKVRNGKKAVELATRAGELSQWKAANILSTVAAAYAEAGDFAAAIRWEEKALEDSEYTKIHGEDSSRRLQLYKNNKPCRDE